MSCPSKISEPMNKAFHKAGDESERILEHGVLVENTQRNENANDGRESISR